MAWNDPTETVVGGSGQVYVAPVGTALPAAHDTNLNAAFAGLGYHSEDGVSVNQSAEIIRLGAWQTKVDIRRMRDTETFRLTFALLQWTEVSLPLAFGGGAVTEPSSGKFKYTPPAASEDLYERALICDVDDGTDRLRFVVPKGNAVEAIESQFTRSQFGMLPITFEALEPDDGTPSWHLLTNVAGMATGS